MNAYSGLSLGLVLAIAGAVMVQARLSDTPGAQADSKCKDYHKLCYLWKRNGNCKLESFQITCPLQCGRCGKSGKPLIDDQPIGATKVRPVLPADCVDNHANCLVHATENYCKMSEYVRRLCPKSCRKCDQ